MTYILCVAAEYIINISVTFLRLTEYMHCCKEKKNRYIIIILVIFFQCELSVQKYKLEILLFLDCFYMIPDNW